LEYIVGRLDIAVVGDGGIPVIMAWRLLLCSQFQLAARWGGIGVDDVFVLDAPGLVKPTLT